MIDEKVLIERLEEQKSDWNDDYNVPINDAIKIVNQLAEEMDVSKMENTTWIPCSERLPEVEEDVLLFLDDYSIKMGYRTIDIVAEGEESFYIYSNPSWYYDDEEVIAWMPLPSAYQPKEDKQK